MASLLSVNSWKLDPVRCAAPVTLDSRQWGSEGNTAGAWLSALCLASCWNSGGRVPRGGPWAQKEPRGRHGTPAVADLHQHRALI